MYRAFELAASQDLSPYSRLLWQRKVSHMIRPDGDTQVVFIARPEQVQMAMELFGQWQRGEVQPQPEDRSDFGSWFSANSFVGSLGRALAAAPLSILTIGACIVLAVLTLSLGHVGLFQALLYPDFSFGGSTIYMARVIDDFGWQQLLKMIGPIMLHGGYVHLAFNMLWFWEFGKRIEARQSSWTMLAVIVFIALVSNTTQYLLGGGNNFVGMSGVVYGMLGYIWMWQLFDPRKGLNLPIGLILVMFAFLVILTVMDLGMIANEAHIAGLLCGVVVGAVMATLSRIHRSMGGPRGRL